MISRREMVTAGVLGTLATAGPADAAAIQTEVEALRSGLKALETQMQEFKGTLEQALRGNSMNFGNLATVKRQIEQYAKTSGKFPEWCDVGLSVFTDVYDWHVRNQQQINITRVAEQRLAIQFMFTQLILRWENDFNYVGTPFDR